MWTSCDRWPDCACGAPRNAAHLCWIPWQHLSRLLRAGGLRQRSQLPRCVWDSWQLDEWTGSEGERGREVGLAVDAGERWLSYPPCQPAFTGSQWSENKGTEMGPWAAPQWWMTLLRAGLVRWQQLRSFMCGCRATSGLKTMSLGFFVVLRNLPRWDEQ